MSGPIDCDVHNAVPTVEALYPYLSDHWRDFMRESRNPSLEPDYYPPGCALAARPEWRPGDGRLPGSDVELMQTQLLDPLGLRYAILNCLYGVQLVRNEYWAAALAEALNGWQAAEWLDRDPRLRASIVVAPQSPELAAEEIARRAADSRFVQVLMLTRSEQTLGRRAHWPIYRAAEQAGLPVTIHAGGCAGHPPTPVGWPSTFVEGYIAHAQAAQTQLVSLVCEGVFAEFPALRVVLAECGFTWLPSLLWRLDKNWKGLRREVPWVNRLPSEIVKEHVRFTLQPVEEAPSATQLVETIEQIEADHILLFSTDYPHWQADWPDHRLPLDLPEDLERRLMYENALATYRLD